LEKRKEKAKDRIEDAGEEIEEAKKKIVEENITITDIPALEELLKEAEKRLEDAEVAFEEGDYGKAFGLATAALNLAKSAKKLIEREEITKVKAEIVGNATQVKVRVKFMSTATQKNALSQEILEKIKLNRTTISYLLEIEIEEEELKERLRAKAKVREGISRVKAEYRFPLNTTNRDEIIEGIYQKLSVLTIEDILNALELKVEEREVEIEVELKEDKAKVDVEVNDIEMKFILSTINRSEIIAEITSKTGLAKEEIEGVIKFERVEEKEVQLEEALKKISKTKEKLMELEEEGMNVTEALKELLEIETELKEGRFVEDLEKVLESIEEEARGEGREG
jgi:hypothetical protein